MKWRLLLLWLLPASSKLSPACDARTEACGARSPLTMPPMLLQTGFRRSTPEALTASSEPPVPSKLWQAVKAQKSSEPSVHVEAAPISSEAPVHTNLVEALKAQKSPEAPMHKDTNLVDSLKAQKSPEVPLHKNLEETAALQQWGEEVVAPASVSLVSAASNSSDVQNASAEVQEVKEVAAAAQIDVFNDERRHRVISAGVFGPAGGQASMAHESDLALTDKLAVGTLDFVSTGRMEYCKSWLYNNSFLCEFGSIFLGLLVCTPLLALSVAAFWGIVSGLKDINQ